VGPGIRVRNAISSIVEVIVVLTLDITPEKVAEIQEATGESTPEAAILSAVEETIRFNRQWEAVKDVASLPFLSDLLDPEVRAAAAR